MNNDEHDSDDDWQTHYGIDDDLAEEMADRQDRAHHALEYGPPREAVVNFAWLVEQWARLAGVQSDRAMVNRAFLARAFAADGQTLLAADELRRLVVDRATVFGEEDPQTLRTRGQLGQVLARGGYPDEGIEIQRALLEDRTRLLGPDAPGVFDTMGNLAESYLLAGRYVEGRDLYADLYERRCRVLGLDHPDTTRTYMNLSAARAKSCEDPDDAIAILEVAIEELENTAGPLDMSTLTARGHLSDALIRGWAFDEAVEVLESLLSDRRMVLGPDHGDTIRSEQMLVRARRWRDDPDWDGED